MKRQLTAFLLLLALSGMSANIYAASQYEAMGDAVQWLLPISAVGMSISENDTEGSMQFLKTFGYTFGATYTVKVGVNRTRPNGAPYSFPSGHTSASFASAGYIHQRYGIKKGRWAYAAATFVGWSRIKANKHYATDVLAGAALGSAMSYFFTSFHDVDLAPYKSGDSSGINILYRW